MKRGEYLGVGFFVHPVPAFAVFLLALNDHYLKHEFPGGLTGKLSDFCGLFFFPLFLCALAGLMGARFSRRWVAMAIVLTDAVFIAVKVWPAAGTAYVNILENLGFPSQIVQDPSDLIALAVNFPLWLYVTAVERKLNT